MQSFSLKRGFTLIELLIVIAIIGILASIVLVSLSNARTKSRIAANQSEARQVASLLHQEFADSGSYTNLIRNQWIPVTTSCDSIPVTGNYAAEYRRLCNSIMDRLNTPATDNNWFVAAPSAGTFSVMVKTSDASGSGTAGTWYCVGSSGNTYEGTYNLTAPGCYNNP